MSTNESETKMTEAVNDIEKALDTWDLVADANDLVWIRDEDGGVAYWDLGAFHSHLDAAHRPTPPFTAAAIKRATA